MTSQAETVELLVKKANFQPTVALAVAEAIEKSMTDPQLVTVPILDARLADQRTETQASLLRLDSKIDVTAERLDSKIDVTAERLEKKIDVTAERLDSKIDVTAERLEKKIDVTAERLSRAIEVGLERLSKEIAGAKVEMIRWVFLTFVGSAAVSVASMAVKYWTTP